MSLRLLALSGSSRRDSYNTRLLRRMVAGASAAGAEVELIDWSAYTLPVFDEDIEAAGVPDAARRLKAAFRSADGFLLAIPENNGGYPAVIKNAIDWCSRGLGDPPGSVYRGKPVLIAGATTGRWGAVRSIRQLREVLGYLGCVLLPESLSLNEADQAFGEDGRLLDKKADAQALALGASLLRATRALKA